MMIADLVVVGQDIICMPSMSSIPISYNPKTRLCFPPLDLINLSDSFKELAGLAAQHAGHRQAGVEDPLPLQGPLLLPHQKS